MKNIFATCVAAALLAVPAFADTITYDAAGVQIDAPAGWTVTKSADGISLDAPGKDVSIVFMHIPGKTPEKAIAAVEAELDKAVGKVAWGEKPTKEKLNGMDAEIWAGTAKDGKLQVEAAYLDTPNDQVLGVYWFDTPESETKYKKDTDQIIQGIKPIEKK